MKKLLNWAVEYLYFSFTFYFKGKAYLNFTENTGVYAGA